jgi:hypothetical protein
VLHTGGLVHLGPLVQVALRHALRTLCFDPFPATFASDLLHLVQLCLLGLSRFASTLDGLLREASGGEEDAVGRLVGILTRPDAVEAAVPGRGDRGKLARGAREEAFGVLREVRLRVRL